MLKKDGWRGKNRKQIFEDYEFVQSQIEKLQAKFKVFFSFLYVIFL